MASRSGIRAGVNVSSSRTGGPGNSGVLVFSNPEGKKGSAPTVASMASGSSPARRTR